MQDEGCIQSQKKQNFLPFIKKIIYRIKNSVDYCEMGINNKKLSDNPLMLKENKANPHKNKKISKEKS